MVLPFNNYVCITCLKDRIYSIKIRIYIYKDACISYNIYIY